MRGEGKGRGRKRKGGERMSMGVGSLPSAKDHTQFLRRREICVRRGGNVLENRRGGDGREGNGWGVKRKEEDWCGESAKCQ